MGKTFDKKIILEGGEEYYGYGFGADVDKVCEIVFNTSMAGYQEILSDPSYTYQAIVMTYPLIGNYGMAADDYETKRPTAGALIVRDYNDDPSNFRSEKTLAQVMKEFGIAGVEGVDTRKLGRSVRDHGSRLALITGADTPLKAGLELLAKTEVPHDAVAQVSCKEAWEISAGMDAYLTACSDCRTEVQDLQHLKTPYHVVAIDCGMKKSIPKSLVRHGCRVTVVPWNTQADEILALKPDGIFISNGPGDPQDVPETVHTVKQLIGSCPVFGICLGHQIIALAYGAQTYKLKFGHRGGNHPVLDIATGKIEVTSQNHSYAVEADSLNGTGLKVTHINLLDQTIEGISCEKDNVFSVQYHPESNPGPQDSDHLFSRFVDMMAAK